MNEMQKILKLFNQPFCIINKGKNVHVYKGEIKEYERIADLPCLEKKGVNYISMLPYNQMKERGFEVIDEGEKILTLHIEENYDLNTDIFLNMIEEISIEIEGAISSDITDEEYKKIVEKVINNEIKNGEGSNFLMSRKYHGQIKDYKYAHIFSIFKRLIENESGSYWNFIYYSGNSIFVGASPERHLTIENATTYMNPICGTLPKVGEGEFRNRLETFLENPKEINELFQVVDEELKVVCKICPKEGKVIGPMLKEMATLIHTEYMLEGKGGSDVFTSLRESLYAATMVGSPLENAARVIKKYETSSRRYYSSAICSFGKDENEKIFLDSAITIRTMEVKLDGSFTIQTGASIVRDSVPELECKELQAKAQGLINAILNMKVRETLLPRVMDGDLMRRLNNRNLYLSKFWLDPVRKNISNNQNITVQLIDNEDDFIYMIKHMLEYLGYKTDVVKYKDYKFNNNYDITVVGPGPGDPNNIEHDKMKILYNIVNELIKNNRKILGVCLGHQILSKSLGFNLTRSIVPFQGMQKEIELFGELKKVGFYNSYFAMDDEGVNGVIVSKDDEGKIFALKGNNFISFQFHLESILTQYGMDILKGAMGHLL